MEMLGTTGRVAGDPLATGADTETELARPPGPGPLRPGGADTETERARLRAQVAWLQAERAALWWAVFHDELTGLANRRGLPRFAAPLLRERGRPAAVIALDLNGVKTMH